MSGPILGEHNVMITSNDGKNYEQDPSCNKLELFFNVIALM